jgi:hypothetical protein
MQYRRTKNVAWRRIGGETVIVNLDRRRMLALNESGAAVWDALAGESDDKSPEPRPGSAEGEADDERLNEFFADLEREGVLERADEVPVALLAGAAARAVEAAPAVIWREELHRFGGSCAMLPTQSAICNQQPYSS